MSQFTNSLDVLHQTLNEKPEFAAFIRVNAKSQPRYNVMKSIY